jgi:hypothetical protein
MQIWHTLLKRQLQCSQQQLPLRKMLLLRWLLGLGRLQLPVD